MFKQITLAAAALAVSGAALVPATPAAAQRYDNRYYGDRYERGYYDNRYYGRDDYRRYKKCKRQGDAGTIIGAIAGGLLGRALPGNNTTGTILGAGAGALAGRAIDKGDRPYYCR
jgi:uncharacterized protein YcfJ